MIQHLATRKDDTWHLLLQDNLKFKLLLLLHHKAVEQIWRKDYVPASTYTGLQMFMTS